VSHPVTSIPLEDKAEGGVRGGKRRKVFAEFMLILERTYNGLIQLFL
jgi:hypothetical protein